MFHPWRLLREMPQITVIWTELNHKSALTDGVSQIWLDRRLFQVERRCSLTHELIHIERGHTSRQSAAIEEAVRAETARRLIPSMNCSDINAGRSPSKSSQTASGSPPRYSKTGSTTSIKNKAGSLPRPIVIPERINLPTSNVCGTLGPWTIRQQNAVALSAGRIR